MDRWPSVLLELGRISAGGEALRVRREGGRGGRVMLLQETVTGESWAPEVSRGRLRLIQQEFKLLACTSCIPLFLASVGSVPCHLLISECMFLMSASI